MSKVFVDTNLIIYSIDEGEPEKRDKCRRLLRSLAEDGAGVISTQVLQETYSVATRKLRIEPFEARAIVQRLEASSEIILLTPPIIFQAIDCSILNTISFWDALLVAAAASARCEKLWTEDLPDGQTLLGVRIENPLKEPLPQIRTD
ncbi:MAG: PIN domain-containing protein [Planctomycetes bacterium]|nr:PIN domain-containing protein [Planctomycetota bacterium]